MGISEILQEGGPFMEAEIQYLIKGIAVPPLSLAGLQVSQLFWGVDSGQSE